MSVRSIVSLGGLVLARMEMDHGSWQAAVMIGVCGSSMLSSELSRCDWLGKGETFRISSV